MGPQEETEEKLRKTKFIMLTSPRNRRHGTPCRATWKNTRVVKRQKIGARERFRPQPLLGFPCKSQDRTG